MHLTDEQTELRSTLRSFFESEAPTHVIRELDRSEEFPVDIYRKMAELGVTGLGLPEKYGGTPVDEVTLCLAIEEIARASGALTYATIPTLTFCARGILRFGTEEQRERFLPKICAGEIRMAMGLTEPEVGSDLSNLSTRAVADGDDYVISGQKVFTTGADTADYIFAIVRTEADPNVSVTRGLSVFLIPTDAEGVTIRSLPKLAGQATHTCEVFLSNVRVSRSNMIGTLNEGIKVIFELLDGERIYVGAICSGIAQGALDTARKYAAERSQFGKPIIEHQAVAHHLANMAMDVHVARLATFDAATLLEDGQPCSMEASMAKVVASEAASRCVSRGMQVLGGYSYITDFPMERYWREVKLYEIAGGSNEIQRNIIAKHVGSK